MQDFDFKNEIDHCAELDIDWELFKGKTFLITGGTGLVGKYLASVLLRHNRKYHADMKIVIVGRNEEKFKKRFKDVDGFDDILFLQHDVQKPFDISFRIDYIIHMASNTHPRLYATDPIGTVMSNISGTYNLLELASQNSGCRFMFTSSGDVYGDNNSDKEFISETDCGYIDCNTLRAGYIEGKRASEALCNAYYEAKNIDFVIARLCRVYGSTMNMEDSKAISQFIKNAIANEDIVLKSKGEQVFSYLYVYDVVTALLKILTNGVCGNAYNVADREQALSLRALGEILADIGNSKMVFSLPDKVEAKGASTFKNVKLDGEKLKSIGWNAEISLKNGLRWTVEYLRSL